jgi:hypothetical protein
VQKTADSLSDFGDAETIRALCVAASRGRHFLFGCRSKDVLARVPLTRATHSRARNSSGLVTLKKQRALLGPALYRGEYATGRKITP